MKNRNRSSRAAAILCMVTALSGCAGLVRSDYVPPAVTTPAAWNHAQAKDDTAASPGTPWWRAFNDPQLDRLIDDVLKNNNNLAAAGILVKRAWLEAGLAADKQRPALSASISNTHAYAMGGNATGSHSNSAAITLSYEADLWGRLSSARDAAEWEAHATEQDRANTAWALVATTTKLYWQIAYLNQRVDLSEQNIAYARRSLAISQAKLEAGSVSPIDVALSEQTLAAQEADLTDLVQQRVEARNAMSILFNAPPGKRIAERSRLPEANLPAVAAGLPAEMLSRRPDLHAAELRLRETLATADASRASYYPKLSLTGSLGSSSAALANVLTNPVASLGAGLTLPFLQWNEMRLTIQVSQADYEKAVIDFRQTLYAAMADVENALSARSQYLAQSEKLEKSLAAARVSEKLYALRYASGAIPLQTLLDAEQTRRAAEIALVQNRYNRFANHVTLCQALGGNTEAASR